LLAILLALLACHFRRGLMGFFAETLILRRKSFDRNCLIWSTSLSSSSAKLWPTNAVASRTANRICRKTWGRTIRIAKASRDKRVFSNLRGEQSQSRLDCRSPRERLSDLQFPVLPAGEIARREQFKFWFQR
jgi:hypothetical protein